MILNLSGGDSSVSAEGVKYGDSNVGVALDVLEDELTANGQRIYLDYQNGQYGYNTDALRGADTFSPFKSGGGNEFNILTTVSPVAGDKLPTIEGNGYIVIRRMPSASNATDNIQVFIDGNTIGFMAKSYFNSAIHNGYYKFYFQKSVSFTGGRTNDLYSYQTLLADKPLEDKYVITQGKTSGTNYTTITGRGEILISNFASASTIYYKVDDNEEVAFTYYYYDCLDLYFNNSITFKSHSGDQYPFYYIAYREL